MNTLINKYKVLLNACRFSVLYNSQIAKMQMAALLSLDSSFADELRFLAA